MENSCHRSILIEANVTVRSLVEMGWKNFVGLRHDTRLGFYANGLHHVSLVEAIDGVIAPGTTGKATFLMLSDALFETDVAVGSKVELKAGPTTVAVAEILSMRPVWTKRDPANERGYVILDVQGRMLE